MNTQRTKGQFAYRVCVSRRSVSARGHSVTMSRRAFFCTIQLLFAFFRDSNKMAAGTKRAIILNQTPTAEIMSMPHAANAVRINVKILLKHQKVCIIITEYKMSNFMNIPTYIQRL